MFVDRWRAAPFLRLLPPLVAGVAAGMYFPLIPWECMILCVLVWMIPSFLSVGKRFVWLKYRGMAVLGLMCCLGMTLVCLSDVRRIGRWYGHSLKDSMYCVAVLKEPPVKKKQSWKAEAEVSMLWNGKWKDAEGKLLVYFREDPGLDYGSRILFSGEPQRIRGSGNPGAFDYAKYYSYRQIYHQIFLNKTSWQKLHGDGGNRPGHWLNAARNYSLGTLKKYIPDKTAYGVAQALLIGYRDELDKDVVQAYTNTGVVHIIAISGLHLGLIYMSLLQLLKWLPRKRWADMLKALLLIVVLWGFSLLTGATASVLRSAVMFTTIALGQFVIARHSDIFNTLAAAAFLLLCYNPFFLVDAGFQLSFLAVAGIVICYQPLYDLWEVKNKWLDKLWQMVAVSLAAQAFTWPVCLFYFHQFPNYFLLANIVAVPLSTLLLYGEILLMMLAEMPMVAALAGKALEWGIILMNTIIQWIDDIPGAVVNNIPMDMIGMFLLYGFTIAVLTAWLLKKKGAVWWVLGLMTVFSGLVAAQRIRWLGQHLLVIYDLPKLTVVEYVKGRGSGRMGDSAGLEHPQLAASQLSLGTGVKSLFAPEVLHLQEKVKRGDLSPPGISYLQKGLKSGGLLPREGLHAGISRKIIWPRLDRDYPFEVQTVMKENVIISYTRAGYLVQVGTKRLLVLTGDLRYAPAPAKKIKIDYILLSHNPKVDISRLQEFFIYDRLIFDASSSAFQLRKWKNACNELPLRCFSVPEQGAFVVNL